MLKLVSTSEPARTVLLNPVPRVKLTLSLDDSAEIYLHDRQSGALEMPPTSSC